MQDYYGAPAHLKQANSPAQARCDAIQAEFRAEQRERKSIRREPPPTPRALVPTDDVLRIRLGEELDYARRMLDSMGDTLSTDPVVITRHMVALQSLDVAGQILGHVANVIRSSDPQGAVDLIGMSDLKARLTRTRIA